MIELARMIIFKTIVWNYHKSIRCEFSKFAASNNSIASFISPLLLCQTYRLNLKRGEEDA